MHNNSLPLIIDKKNKPTPPKKGARGFSRGTTLVVFKKYEYISLIRSIAKTLAS
jgi:hypothetical protein